MNHLSLDELKHAEDYCVPEKVGTLVVGGGMSGLYLTWRLLQENPKEDILIFEKSNRTGGRLDSDLISFDEVQPGGATQEIVLKEEEGGMRFTFDGMDNLMALFLSLNAEIKDAKGVSEQPMTDQIVPFPMGSNGNNRLYFRGKSFNNTVSKQDNSKIWEELYHLNPSEKGVYPKQIIDTIFNRILSANPSFVVPKVEDRGPEFWQSFRLECKWNDIPLKDWTLWNLFTEMGFSQECIEMLYRLMGFNGTFLSRMNAGVAYQLLEEFPSEPKFRTLAYGFSTLPNALAKGIGKGKIILKTFVEGISPLAGGKEGYAVKYTTNYDGERAEQKVIHADKVVLAMPRLALEKLFVGSDALNILSNEKSKKLWNTLQTSSNQPLLKINLYYDRPWWGNGSTGLPAVSFGPNFSDLPLGSVYPFYSLDDKSIAALEYEEFMRINNAEIPKDIQEKLDVIDNGNDSKYTKPAALTIYCDYLNINFWKALQENGELFSSPMQDKYSNKSPQTLFAASEAVVEQATKFFKLLFNTSYVPRPVMTSARIWDGTVQIGVPESQQFGYGVHQWALHADDKQVIKDMVNPLENLYTCNEAFSDYQGWVEGALRSTNLVLEQKAFGSLKSMDKVYQEKNGKSSSEAIKEVYAKKSEELIKEYIDEKFDMEKLEIAEENKSELKSDFAISLTDFRVQTPFTQDTASLE